MGWRAGAGPALWPPPVLPPAPGLFSTVTVWPRILVSSFAVAREAMSTAPAGGNGQMRRMGFDGKDWAAAMVGSSNARANANRRDTGKPFEGTVAQIIG